jgi:spermidine synthase
MPDIVTSEERGVRYLHFGSPWIQGAMRLARPWALELEYTRELMLPLLLRRDRGWPASVLQVGLGAASITRFLHRHRPRARLTVVEILPEVVEIARSRFRLPEESAHLRIVIGDACDYMGSARGRHDLIVVDGFDEKGRAGALDSAPFYASCRARLAAGGVLAVNFLTRRKSPAASVGRLREVFGEHVMALPPSEPGNVVGLASGEDLGVGSMQELRAAARALKAETGLDLAPTLARLARA